MKRLFYLAFLIATTFILTGCSVLFSRPVPPTIRAEAPVAVVTLDTQEVSTDSFESTIEAVGAFIEPSRDPDTIASVSYTHLTLPTILLV